MMHRVVCSVSVATHSFIDFVVTRQKTSDGGEARLLRDLLDVDKSTLNDSFEWDIKTPSIQAKPYLSFHQYIEIILLIVAIRSWYSGCMLDQISYSEFYEFMTL